MKNLIKVALGGADVNDGASRQAAYKRVREIIVLNMQSRGVSDEERVHQLDMLEREIRLAESSISFAAMNDSGGDDRTTDGRGEEFHVHEVWRHTDDQTATHDERNFEKGLELPHDKTRESVHDPRQDSTERASAIVQSLVRSIDKQVGADQEQRFAIYETLRAALIGQEKTAKAKTIFNLAELEAAIAEIEARHVSLDDDATNQADDLAEKPSPSPMRSKRSTASLTPADNRKKEVQPASVIRGEDDELLALLQTAGDDQFETASGEDQSEGRHFEDSLIRAFGEMDPDSATLQEPAQDDADRSRRSNPAIGLVSAARTSALLKTGMGVALVTTSLSIGITQWSGLVSAQTTDADMRQSRIGVDRPTPFDGKAGASEPALTPSPAANAPAATPTVQTVSLSAERASDGKLAAPPVELASAYFAMEGDNGRAVRSDEMQWSVVRVPSASSHDFNPALYGQATIAELDLQVAVIIRRNEDDKLDASHVVDVTFDGSGLDAMGGVHKLRGIVLQKDADGSRQALKGVALHVDRNAFSLALQDAQAARNFNLELLRHAGIMDVAVMLGNGRKAGIRLMLGSKGRRDLLLALNFWSRKAEKVARISREPRSTEPVAPSSAGNAPISAKEAVTTLPSIRGVLRGPVPVPAIKPDRPFTVAMAR